MSPRRRVLEALAHRQADRVPIDFWAVGEVFGRLREELDLPDDEAVLKRFGVDLRYFNGPARRGRAGADGERPAGAEGLDVDHWGVGRKAQTVSGRRRDGTEYTFTYKHLVYSPLAGATSVSEIEHHRWPTADEWDYSGVAAACRAIRRAGFACVAGADRLDRTALLKPAMYLRGTEQFMADLVLEPAIAECILEHVAAYYLDYDRRFFQAAGEGGPGAGADGGEFPIDIFFMGDDMGTQASTWVSPEMYRRFFKGRLAAYCDLAHEFGMKVMYHTCGNVTALVGDFADAGVDILQSLQQAAMGDQLAWLKSQYGGRLSFQGGIDIQSVLPRGTPQEVAEHVRSRAEILAPGGGYVFGTAHAILPDAPTENILALVEAYRQWGTY